MWPRGLKRGSTDSRCLGLRVRISRGYGCPSLVRVVFCHVEVSATGRSLVRKSPSECGVFEFNQGTSQRKPRPTRAVELWEIKDLLRHTVDGQSKVILVQGTEACEAVKLWWGSVALSFKHTNERLASMPCGEFPE